MTLALSSPHHHRHSSTLTSFPPHLTSPFPTSSRPSSVSFTSPRKQPLRPFDPSLTLPQPLPSSARKAVVAHRRASSFHPQLLSPTSLQRPPTPSSSHPTHARIHSAALTCSTFDRFIPQRDPTSPPLSLNTAAHSPGSARSPSLSPSSSSPSSTPPGALTPTRHLHNAHLASSLLPSPTQRTLTFHSSPPRGPGPLSPSVLTSHQRSMSHHLLHSSTLHSLYHHPSPPSLHSPTPLHPTPLRVLDAPHLLDDYYLSLLDWSSTNLIAIALSTSLYIFNPLTSSITNLLSLPPPPPSPPPASDRVQGPRWSRWAVTMGPLCCWMCTQGRGCGGGGCTRRGWVASAGG